MRLKSLQSSLNNSNKEKTMIVCSFSDFNIPLDAYPKKLKGKALHKWIYKQLEQRKKFSCFEIDSDWRDE